MASRGLIAKHGPVKGDHGSGFALVIALAMMALVLLTLISFTTLVMVETSDTGLRIKQDHARQNALYGLRVALAQLQHYAGPDRRATARADILPDGAFHSDSRFWVGVWDTTDTARPRQAMTWLVSGNHREAMAVNPADAPAADGVILLRSPVTNDPAAQVRVAREEVAGHNTQADGHFAYWISDESLKARINIADPYFDTQEPDNAGRSLTRLVSAQGSGIQRISAGSVLPVRPEDPLHHQRLRDLSDLRQLPWVDADAEIAVAEALNDNYHDLTISSYGVLSDARSGGLRKDLTRAFSENRPSPAYFTGDPVWWNRLSEYYRLAGASSLVPAAANENRGSLLPVMVKLNHHVGLIVEPLPEAEGGDEPTYALHTGLHVSVSLHNPYAVPLGPAHYRVESVIPSATAVDGQLDPGDRGYALYLPGLANAEATQYEQNRTRSHHVILQTAEPVTLAAGETMVMSSQPLRDGEPAHLQVGSGETVAVLRPGVATSPVFMYHPMRRLGNALTDLSHADIFGTDGEAVRFRLRTFHPTQSPPMGVRLYVQNDEGGFDYGYGFRRAFEVTDVANPRLHYHSLDEMGATDSNTPPAYGYFLVHDIPSARQKPDSVAVRNLADINLRASFPVADSDAESPGYWHYGLVNSSGLADIEWLDTHFPQNIDYFIAFDSSTNRAFSGPTPLRDGRSPDLALSATVLFDVPPQPPISIAALRHAQVFTRPNVPTYSVGTSHAPVFPAGTPLDSADSDPLFQLNEALWDRFFFSSIPNGADGSWNFPQPPPNARLAYHSANGHLNEASLEDYDLAASALLILGPFNVNSTSATAWRVALSSMRGNLDEDATLMPRVSRTITNGLVDAYHNGDADAYFEDSGRNPVGNNPRQTLWSAYRLLSDAEIDTLAEYIAIEVRRRGPFLSLAEFVNRSLEIIDGDPVTQLKGPLQHAIDQGPGIGENREEARQRLHQGLNSDVIRNDTVPQSGRDGLVGIGRSSSYPAELYALEARSVDAPAYLNQGDLLAALGPILTVRGDTFVIRAYGDSVNPLTGEVVARAWCEAVVQRLPEPVTPADPDPENPGHYETNDDFGRKFTLRAFRWLTEDEV